MKYFIGGVRAIVMVYIVLFCVSNTDNVQVTVLPKYIVFDNIQLFVPIIGALFLGGFAVILSFLGDRYKMNKEIKRLRKQIVSNESELQKLSSISLITETPLDNEQA
ncbi:MAG: LapA family protein [Deferribacteraceae bacterium]|jgi:uncharacterized integral membrane protein|nr:LapA family protein [Deferribacteraceae bacterium]